MSTPVNSHLDNITISIILAALAVQAAGFGTVMLLVDQAAGNPLPGGARTVTYTNATDAATDQIAGDISASTLAAVQTAFAQNPAPAQFKVGRIDTVGAETYATGLVAVLAADDDFYGICIDRRTAADQLLVTAAVEADSRVFILQSADADWKTTGLPAAYTTLAGKERTAVVYHDTSSEWADVAMAARWLAFDPDVISAVAEGGLKNVAALATAPTAAQKGFLDANFANHGLPYGGEVFYVDAGVNAAGRPLYEILTADWFEARLQERIAALRVAKSTRGEKIPVTTEGQALVLAEIDGLFQVGVTAGHFVAGQTASEGVAITAADRSAGRLRFTAEAQVAANARLFEFTINFSTSPISSAA